MTSSYDSDKQEDVVVIEERDKRTYLYIGLATVFGLIFGGILGSVNTANKWESSYQGLESRYQALATEKASLLENFQTHQDSLHSKNAEAAEKLEAQILAQRNEFEHTISNLEEKLAGLKEKNLALISQVERQIDEIKQSQSENAKLSQQANMQATIFERSREVFHRELQISQELEKLEKEREKLLATIKESNEQCELYLEGTSWDATSDSCDKYEVANARLSQIDQRIELHRLDLKQIKQITDELGL